jgi:hypothetical protein
MFQLNPASLDSDNNSESVKLYKKNNKTIKNRANKVSFSENVVDNSNLNNQGSQVTQGSQGNQEKIENISNLISKLHTSSDDDNEDNNFRELLNEHENANGSGTGTKKISQTYGTVKLGSVIDDELNKMQSVNDNNITNATYLNSHQNNSFSNLDESYSKTFENYDFNSLNKGTGLNLDNNKLLSKLDYIVHLLEEQRGEKTNHITEELVLYLFLGIFIIFVLDSFARASKYVR